MSEAAKGRGKALVVVLLVQLLVGGAFIGLVVTDSFNCSGGGGSTQAAPTGVTKP
ncbi:MAG: hypothetical protein NTY57_07110 [Solirubrobacterales bacterium]|nr:hypothetical protein [Solirubrobacterales bacterium]